VNDTLGHEAGDELLVWVVSELDSTVRPGDTIGRLGGDEFAVLLPRTAYDEAEAIAARITSAIAARIDVTNGIAAFPEDGGEREALLRFADTALYEAKARRPVPVAD
jgi:diguanylate cyclase (GGDEF)-like protein